MSDDPLLLEAMREVDALTPGSAPLAPACPAVPPQARIPHDAIMHFDPVTETVTLITGKKVTRAYYEAFKHRPMRLFR